MAVTHEVLHIDLNDMQCNPELTYQEYLHLRTTMEMHADQLRDRIAFWQKQGNMSVLQATDERDLRTTEAIIEKLRASLK